MSIEEWRQIEGWPGYEVSDLGNVRSYKRWGASATGPCPHLLTPIRFKKGGHLSVAFWRDGWRVRLRIHHLVLLAFVGPRPDGLVTRHLDGNATNNALTNLRYGTHSENVRDAVAHGTHSSTRKTHCPRGHDYETRGNRRFCRTCQNESNRRSKARMRAAA